MTMIKVLDHQTARSAEFLAGCPGAWPRVEVIADGPLTADEAAKGFRLVTPEEWLALKATHRAAWDAWAAGREVEERTLRQSRRAALADLETIAATSGALTNAQLSNAARAMADIVARAIRSGAVDIERG